MDLVLYPRAAPSDRLRVWAGAFFQTQTPSLAWRLNGVPQTPRALRPISSVRSDAMLSPNTRRAFAGVYEFANLQPDTRYTITVESGGERGDWSMRTLPAALPSGMDQSFNVLMVSCFYQAEDVAGVAGTIISQLKAAAQPHLTLLMGDQVYLDLPTHLLFPTDLVSLADKFETDYRRNWAGPQGYAQVLAAAPSISIPDDHEYWNNFPNVTPVVANTWSAGGRQTWQRAAQTMYNGFQFPYANFQPPNPASLGDSLTLDIAPLSFFLSDGRSFRDPDRQFTLTTAGRAQLEAWAQRVIDQRLVGVFVSGQSLFTEPASFVVGKTGDYEMPNYTDFEPIVQALARIADAGRPLLCLTGDVHWGRVTEAHEYTANGRIAMREIITSPASLVATIGADQLAGIGAVLGGLFGASADPWPRHHAADPPPAFFASKELGARFACANPPLYRQRGNHATLLSFRQSGGVVDLRVTYYPLSLTDAIRTPVVAGSFQLRSR